MAFKLIESAQARWRAVNAPHLVALVAPVPVRTRPPGRREDRRQHDDHPHAASSDVEDVTDQTLVAVARCLARVRIGARFQQIQDAVQSIDLTVTEIHRYPGIQTEEIDPPTPHASP